MRDNRAEIGPRLTFDLPEPPTINSMLRLYSHFHVRGMQRVPLYQIRRREYEVKCEVYTKNYGIKPPDHPWPEWQIQSAIFRVWTPKDPIELLASLKWAVDFLVRGGYVKDDSPRELLYIPEYIGLLEPEEPRLKSTLLRGICQTINRANRGVELTIIQ